MDFWKTCTSYDVSCRLKFFRGTVLWTIWYVYTHHDCCFLRCGTFSSTLRMYGILMDIFHSFAMGLDLQVNHIRVKVWDTNDQILHVTSMGKLAARIGLSRALVSALILLALVIFFSTVIYSWKWMLLHFQPLWWALWLIAAFPAITASILVCWKGGYTLHHEIFPCECSNYLSYYYLFIVHYTRV